MESKVVFDILGIPVTENVVWTWGIMAVLIAASFLLSRNLKRVPTGFQHVTELIVDGLEGLVVRVMGSRGRVFVPFIIALALFILLANFASILPGGVSPTASLSTTAALAVLVLLVSHGAEIKQKGLKTYIKGYFSPYFILFPLNVIGEIAKVLSHAFRLFGNIFGGGIILSIIYMFVPVVIPGILNIWFGFFQGIIQAAVFVMLAIVYIQVRLE
ncbi:MAG: F0F1 ATP synthase subunit A [Firmicutes bacterium]|nr:F0F1 ATP synthase subunit A [Bacillota bacterium]